eukprot:jgi/Mesen1/2433/ME000157S01573
MSEEGGPPPHVETTPSEASRPAENKTGNSGEAAGMKESDNGEIAEEQVAGGETSGRGLVSIPSLAVLSWQGLVSRVQTTIRGSSQDIGWLQRESSLPPVEDGTDRFIALLGRITNGVHTLPDSLVYLLIPGLFSNLSPLYLLETKKHFSTIGLACHIARLDSQAPVEINAAAIKHYIEELYWGTGKRVVLLGHSKGGVDAAAALAIYRDDLVEKVAGLVAVQSPYGGTPVASDLIRQGQIADVQFRRVLDLLMRRIIKGDIRSLEDLTYARRREFLAQHPIPSGIPVVCFHSEASRAPAVISSLSHIHQAEIPWGNAQGGGNDLDAASNKSIPVAAPLAAVLALVALQLELRYGEKSDGLVARKDAEIPGSIAVRPERKLDHAFMVFAPSKKNPKDVDAAQICEALITLLLESAGAPNILEHGEQAS